MHINPKILVRGRLNLKRRINSCQRPANVRTVASNFNLADLTWLWLAKEEREKKEKEREKKKEAGHTRG